jgi:hypothetical protein
MKIQKFNEMSDVNHKEYDEYANIDISILKNLVLELHKIEDTLYEIKHDIHQYNDFIGEYVVFVTERFSGSGPKMFFIPSSIGLNREKDGINIFLKDIYHRYVINIKNIETIKSVDQIANEDPKLFLELYNFYITKSHAPYMDVFGKEEYKYMIDSTEKYNF